MAQLFGEYFSREQLLPYLGSMLQVAGAKSYTFRNGRGHGVKAIDVKTGSGLNYSVLIDRGMDIAFAEYCDKPLGWIAKTGITGPEYFENGGIDFLRSFTGGLFTTCGLTQVGAPGQDGDEVLGIHGRISHLPAETFNTEERWEEEEFIISINGQLRESCLYAENLVLQRQISSHLGDTKIRVSDRVENQGYVDTPFMLLYHVNLGFPIVSEHSRLYSSAVKVEPWNDTAIQGNGAYDRFEKPVPGYLYQNFLHHMPKNKDLVSVAVVNEKLEFGVYLSYSPDQMPCFTEWKMMGSQDYVVGLEPGNCIPEGRIEARNNGRLEMLKPSEVRHFNFEIGVLPNRVEIDSFISKL